MLRDTASILHHQLLPAMPSNTTMNDIYDIKDDFCDQKYWWSPKGIAERRCHKAYWSGHVVGGEHVACRELHATSAASATLTDIHLAMRKNMVATITPHDGFGDQIDWRSLRSETNLVASKHLKLAEKSTART